MFDNKNKHSFRQVLEIKYNNLKKTMLKKNKKIKKICYNNFIMK